MQQLEVYDIQVWDGGDRHNHKFFLSNKAEAQKYVEKNRYDRFDTRVLIIFDTLEEAGENELKLVRERVIAGLTHLERRAMGVI